MTSVTVMVFIVMVLAMANKCYKKFFKKICTKLCKLIKLRKKIIKMPNIELPEKDSDSDIGKYGKVNHTGDTTIEES